MKKRPPCEICGEPSLVFMFDKFYCGLCTAKWDKKNKENQVKAMKESLDGS